MNGAIYSLFISLSLRMTVVTVFTLLIKLIFCKKLSAAAQCALWIVLPVQLLFCVFRVSIPARTSIYNALPAVTAAYEAPPASGYDIRNMIACIYAAGAVLLALWYIGVFITHRIAVFRLPAAEDDMTQSVLRETKSELCIEKRITPKRGGYAHTIGSAIVIPDGYSREELRQVMLHELCHCKHRDNLKLWAATAVICLNWFNPIIWLAFRLFRSDIEMYCDDSVLKRTDSRRAYALTLVKTASDSIRFIPGASSAANGTRDVKRRVKRIADRKKKKPAWLVAAALMSVTASCLCLTDAVTTAVETHTEIAVTPVPIEPSQAPEEETAAPTEAPADTDAPRRAEETQRETAGEEVVPQIRRAADEVAVTVPEPVAEEPEPRDEIIEEQPESVSANGSKETYTLDDGRTAILHYDDGELETGYIIDTEE